jgi:hypothetical protein
MKRTTLLQRMLEENFAWLMMFLMFLLLVRSIRYANRMPCLLDAHPRDRTSRGAWP